MKESLRDKTRDDLTFALNAAGVGSEMSDRGRVEDKVENSWYQRSLGVIDISEGAIKWINILKKIEKSYCLVRTLTNLNYVSTMEHKDIFNGAQREQTIWKYQYFL